MPQNSLSSYDSYRLRLHQEVVFLLTVSKNGDNNVIKLWDLGYPGSDSIPLSSVALMIQSIKYEIYPISPTLGLCLTILPIVLSVGLARISIYEIYPLDPSSFFHERSTLKVFGYVKVITASEERLACVCGFGSIGVWDITNYLTAY